MGLGGYGVAETHNPHPTLPEGMSETRLGVCGKCSSTGNTLCDLE